MPGDATGPIVFTIFLVFTGAAVFLRRRCGPPVVAGRLYRSWCLVRSIGLGFVTDPDLIRSISEFGIMFLLFLLGLNLQPQELIRMVSKTTQ